MLSKPAHAKPQDQFVNETPAQQAKHREIAEKYKRKNKKKRGGRGSSLPYRLRDLRALIADRYGGPLPEHGARVDLIVLIHHLVWLGDPRACALYKDRLYPWLDEDEHAALLATAREKPLSWSADQLAEELDLDYATRQRLGITTIGATDFPEAKRKRRRKNRKNSARRASRVKAGATPHAASLAQTEPWIDEGISRATYFRRQREKRQDNCRIETVETNSRTAALTIAGYAVGQTTGAPPPQGGVLARAVPALSEGDAPISTETAYPDRIFPTAAREAISISTSSSM
jgi:hypothetical protein